MITDMDKWTKIRCDVLAGDMSKREACRKYNLNFRTIQKILAHEEPPGYRRKEARNKPIIGPFISIIQEILESDKKVHPKQRHTGKRIFERAQEDSEYKGMGTTCLALIVDSGNAFMGHVGDSRGYLIRDGKI